jgi:hypothetical protein
MNRIKNIISNISSFTIPFMSTFIWNVSTFVLYCEKKMNHLYNSNGFVKRTTDYYTNFKQKLTTFFDYSLKEPKQMRWT